MSKWRMLSEGVRARRIAREIKKEFPNFGIRFKDELYFAKRLKSFCKYIGSDYFARASSYYDQIYFVTKSDITRPGNPRTLSRTLMHEWVHMKDATTFFGLLPWVNPLANYVLYTILYLQYPLALFAFLSVFNYWFLLFLVFLIPFSPVKMIAEIRACRIEVERGSYQQRLLKHFSEMHVLLFKKFILAQIKKPSPYKKQMIAIWNGGDSLGSTVKK